MSSAAFSRAKVPGQKSTPNLRIGYKASGNQDSLGKVRVCRSADKDK